MGEETGCAIKKKKKIKMPKTQDKTFLGAKANVHSEQASNKMAGQGAENSGSRTGPGWAGPRTAVQCENG